jgi:hypothetical protein
MVVSALSSVKSGPPKSPACCPVMTTRVSGSASFEAASRDACGPSLLRRDHARELGRLPRPGL